MSCYNRGSTPLASTSLRFNEVGGWRVKSGNRSRFVHLIPSMSQGWVERGFPGGAGHPRDRIRVLDADGTLLSLTSPHLLQQKPLRKKILALRAGKLCSGALKIPHESRVSHRPMPQIRRDNGRRRSLFHIRHSSAPVPPVPAPRPAPTLPGPSNGHSLAEENSI